MAEDLVNIRLSTHATEVVDLINETGMFDDKISIAKFALAYAVNNYFDEINPEKVDSESDSGGTNYNVGTVDSDHFMSNIMTVLYPDTATPYRYARALMIYGLNKLREKIEAEGMQYISKYI